MGGHTATVRCLQWDHNVSVFVPGNNPVPPPPSKCLHFSPTKFAADVLKLFQSETGISLFDPNNDIKTEV